MREFPYPEKLIEDPQVSYGNQLRRVPVVQTLDNTVPGINRSPVDKY